MTERLKNCQLESKNLVRYGANRDRAIIKAIEEHGALTTDQIQVLFFPFKSGLRKARERLAVLVKQKRIQFCRFSPDTPNIYYIGRRHGRIEHLIALNWVYIWLRKRLMSCQSIYYWKREINYGILQTDALAGIKNPGGINTPGEIKWYFVELDRSDSSHNPFDKLPKYNGFFDEHDTLGLWWIEKATTFPKILVVTESEKRKQWIEEQVKNPQINTNGLRFEVKLLSSIMEEAK